MDPEVRDLCQVIFGKRSQESRAGSGEVGERRKQSWKGGVNEQVAHEGSGASILLRPLWEAVQNTRPAVPLGWGPVGSFTSSSPSSVRLAWGSCVPAQPAAVAEAARRRPRGCPREKPVCAELPSKAKGTTRRGLAVAASVGMARETRPSLQKRQETDEFSLYLIKNVTEGGLIPACIFQLLPAHPFLSQSVIFTRGS